ncbi:SRPBCC domain-containing protein [Leptospira wolffii]|uniref:ATPase n=1 Tax=Leptospira wolffii TaxID=409998 RepID=A0A2M9ZDH8_9LEPT|nr:SRPBCC domain-containing protein [Leptospira wolffii]PJZ66488.1 ATPase [Leptospira wolffii]TGL46334.1 ATPase [Leptospira wolffii]
MKTLKTIAHENFSIERIYNATAKAVYSAWASSEAKSHWFFGPKEWKLIRRELDFRVGGIEILHGKFGDTMETLYTARFHELLEDTRLVFVYDMHLNGVLYSVSLISVQIENLGPKRTKLVFTEHVAFLDGSTDGAAGVASREAGTAVHLDKLTEYLSELESGE